MTAGAICNFHCAGSGCKPVVAILERVELLGRQPIFLAELDRIMAGAADLYRHVNRRYRRSRVFSSINFMLSMAIGARGRIQVPFLQSSPMDTSFVNCRNLGMTEGARLHNVSFVHRGERVTRLLQIVGPVAITAGCGLLISGFERDPVNAFFISGEEGGRKANLLLNLGIIQMTLQAKAGLTLLIGTRNDVVRTMACHTRRSPRLPGPRNAAMRGRGEQRQGLVMTFAANTGDVDSADGRFRVFCRPYIVGSMAGFAFSNNPMDAAFKVRGLVAIPAIDRFDGLRVRNFAGAKPNVAAHAGQRCVYGFLQGCFVNKQRYRLPALAHVESAIAVAGQAILRRLRKSSR